MSTNGHTYKWEDVASPLSYNLAAVGNVALKHRPVAPGSMIDVVSLRESLFSGELAQRLKVPKPVLINELYEGGTLWMTDVPQEVREARKAARDLMVMPGDRVLVGGLGIGLIAKLLADKGAKVTVVEINPEIVELIRQASKWKDPV